MRPSGYYAVYDLGRVTAVVRGYRAARALSPQRSYTRHRSRLDAEEHAAWWNRRRELEEHAAAARRYDTNSRT